MKKLLIGFMCIIALALVGCGGNVPDSPDRCEEGYVYVGYIFEWDSIYGKGICAIEAESDYNAAEDGDIATVELIYDIALAEYTRGTLTPELLDELVGEFESVDDGAGSGSYQFQISAYKTAVLLDYLYDRIRGLE